MSAKPHGISSTGAIDRQDDLVRKFAETHPDGCVSIQTDQERREIVVDHQVLDYCKKKKDSLLEQLQSGSATLYDRAVAVIKEFETEPFAFAGHAMMDRIYGSTPLSSNIKLVRMRDERIRQYGLFHFMLEILQTSVTIETQDELRKFKSMVDWVFSILAKDVATPSDERQVVRECLTVLPHTP